MMKLQVLVFLSLFTLISATTLSENNDSKILSEKRSGDLQNENPVKVLAQYDEAIHGPGKAFRMLGPEVDSFNHPDGSFNIQAYHKEMIKLVDNHEATQRRLIKSEIHFKKRSLSDQHQHQKERRDASSGSIFNSDIQYQTETIFTIGVGTPMQKLPFVLNFDSTDTVVFSTSAAKGKNPKRQAQCISNTAGYDISTSSSAERGNSFSKSESFSQSGLQKRDQVGFFSGISVTDTFWFLLNGNANLWFNREFLMSTVALITCASFYVNTYANELGLGLGGAVALSWINALLLIALIPTFGFSIRFHVDKLVSQPPSAQAEILIGGTDGARYVGALMNYPVVKSKDASQYLLFMISMGAVQIVQGSQTGTIGIIGNIEFSLAHSFIYLDPTLVQLIYITIRNSKTPSATNPFYTYLCNAPPTISFNAIDSTGTNRLLTLNADDWNYGLSPEFPGYCIGAIQALPSTSPRQIMGVQFLKSFYYVQQYTTDRTQALSVQLGVSTRT